MFVTDVLPENCVLIDSRPFSEFNLGHLAGAQNLDLSSTMARLRTKDDFARFAEAMAELNGKLGVRPESHVVVYDHGLNTRIAKTAFVLAMGGAQVNVWPSGWEGQAHSQVETKPTEAGPWSVPNREIFLTADEVLSTPKLFDVREANEVERGKIPGAVNVPLGRFSQEFNLSDFGLSVGEEVGVYCRSGARSAVVYWLLREKGVRAKNYLGSILEWQSIKEFPLERPAVKL